MKYRSQLKKLLSLQAALSAAWDKAVSVNARAALCGIEEALSAIQADIDLDIERSQQEASK